MMKGAVYDVGDIAVFFLKSCFGAALIGATFGMLFVIWIRLASDKLDHKSGMIQITLTIGAAYWSFIFAEGVFHVSGVLSNVVCSIILAHKMWPSVTETKAMHEIW